MKIGLIGDSTVAVQSGWGPAFSGHFDGRTEILNYAKNGAFLRSLTDKLDMLLRAKPDYVLIQFGHNDQKQYDTRVYSDLLKSYAVRVRAAGGKPVILSSVVRRSFGKDGKVVSTMVRNERYSYKDTLYAYAEAARLVAVELDIPFNDLYSISEAHHNKIGQEASMAYNFKEGDRTHFNEKGSQAIAGLIIAELTQLVPVLKDYLKADESRGAVK